MDREKTVAVVDLAIVGNGGDWKKRWLPQECNWLNRADRRDISGSHPSKRICFAFSVALCHCQHYSDDLVCGKWWRGQAALMHCFLSGRVTWHDKVAHSLADWVAGWRIRKQTCTSCHLDFGCVSSSDGTWITHIDWIKQTKESCIWNF